MDIKKYPAFTRLSNYFEQKNYQLGHKDPEESSIYLGYDKIQYIAHHPELYGRKFYMDYIANHEYSLTGDENALATMPLEYIDEEMAIAAMFAAIDHNKHMCRRGDCSSWFYSLHERKPEVISKDMYIIAARCFAYRP